MILENDLYDLKSLLKIPLRVFYHIGNASEKICNLDLNEVAFIFEQAEHFFHLLVSLNFLPLYVNVGWIVRYV